MWEYSPSSVNIASDCLKVKRALLWVRKKRLERKGGKIDVADISLASDEVDLFLDLREALRSLGDPADRGYKNRGTRSTANEPVMMMS